MIRIVISDPHQLYRETLASMLSADSNISVIALCSVNSLVPGMIRDLQPDIVLVDPAVKNNSEANIIQKIRASAAVKIICLSMHSDPAYAKKMFCYGINGFLCKDSSVKQFVLAINEVLAGNRYTCNETAAGLSVTIFQATDYQTIDSAEPALIKEEKEMGWMLQLFYRMFQPKTQAFHPL